MKACFPFKRKWWTKNPQIVVYLRRSLQCPAPIWKTESTISTGVLIPGFSQDQFQKQQTQNYADVDMHHKSIYWVLIYAKYKPEFHMLPNNVVRLTFPGCQGHSVREQQRQDWVILKSRRYALPGLIHHCTWRSFLKYLRDGAILGDLLRPTFHPSRNDPSRWPFTPCFEWPWAQRVATLGLSCDTVVSVLTLVWKLSSPNSDPLDLHVLNIMAVLAKYEGEEADDDDNSDTNPILNPL